jgi:thiamine biosynthesis lipoprotein
MSERRPYAIAELNDRAISTSGDYRDVRIVAGRRVSHTIDPHSGAPVANKLTSISVMHDSAMMADAFATALMAMGPQAGFEFASRHGLAALFLVRAQDGSLRERSTDAFRLVRRPLRGADGATPH